MGIEYKGNQGSKGKRLDPKKISVSVVDYQSGWE